MLEKYAAQNGFSNIAHFSDDGFSGGNFDRPDWKRLIEEIEKGNVCTVISKDMSRIGRDYLQTGFYPEVFFREKGVRFIAISNNIDSQKDELWNLYLNSFPAGTNEIYRERREYDCSCCRQFIRAIGNVVFIKEAVVHTLWELRNLGSTFQPVADALDTYIKAHAVTDVYISKFAKIGTDKNHEWFRDGRIQTWEHFYLELPSKFVDKSRRSVGDLKGPFRDTKNVFMRSLEEITDDAVDIVLELIAQKSL